jgi:hypothetical protein
MSEKEKIEVEMTPEAAPQTGEQVESVTLDATELEERIAPMTFEVAE